MKTDAERSSLITFGMTVRDLRRKAEISQEDLAEKADVHRTYIGMVERGEKNVTLLTMIRLADALDVTVFDLIRGILHGQ